MKTKIFFPIFLIALILSFPKISFSEESWSAENFKLAKVSTPEGKKPDISLELNIEEAFPPDEFDELDGEELGEAYDPLEPFNRLMWDFNNTLYDYALEPVARGYIKITPEIFRKMVANFFNNASTPIYFVSSILQGNKEKVDRTIGRFFINTTMGIGGLFDPASSRYKLKKVNENIDQALGYHKVPNGPFLMLPVFGPTTLRGVVAKIPQIFLGPGFLLGINLLPTIGARGLETVNKYSFHLDDKEDLDSFAIDPYTSVKDYYIQHQSTLINN